MEQIPDEKSPGIGEKTDLEQMETPLLEPNQTRAAAIFEAMPHIHTVWFDENGGWRFFETPGSIAINKPSKPADLSINDL